MPYHAIVRGTFTGGYMSQSLGGRLRRALRASVLAGLAALSLGFAPPAHAVKHVLLLFPYEDAMGTNTPLRSGMSEVLHSAAERVEVYSEFLDAARFPSPDDEQHMVEFLRRKYAANRIDLVVTIGQPATRSCSATATRCSP